MTSNCHDGECPIASSYVVDILDNQFCASNHWNDVSNDLCGQCNPGLVEWNGSCVNCNTVQVGLLFGFILLSFVYLFFIYKISQSARSDGKILVYFVQAGIYQFGSYNQYITWLGFSNFDLLQSSGSTCIGPLNAYQTFEISTLLPLIFLGELMIVMICHYLLHGLMSRSHFMRRYCSKSNESPSFQEVKLKLPNNFLLHKYVRSSFALLCFAYLQISNNCINYLNCVYVNGLYVMFSSPSINCNSLEYQSLLPLVVILICIMVCMFPLMLVLLLYWNRNKLDDVKVKAYIGNLYESYNPAAW